MTRGLAAALVLALTAAAQPGAEYRAFWVDTFNTALNNHANVVAVVNNAKLARANAILAQVRRRGDAWYLDSLEPAPDFVSIAPGFDPLQDLLTEAHAAAIEVHAFVIAGAVWNKNPALPASAAAGPPSDPAHVFNRHGGYDPAANTITPGPDNWLTRTLLPDATGSIGFSGHRFGNDFWLDFGHPEAAAYTVEVLMRLVRGYAIDGLHLDRIRYPEFSVAGLAQTPSTGVSIGYNAVSVARFQQHYGIAAGSPPPAPNDARWAQWRRDQVTNLVRRIYLSALAIRPEVKLSAALIAFGGGPVTEADWKNAEAYWRVFQDWRAWCEEGILDLAIPMVYKRDHVRSEETMFNQWSEWTRNHQYARASMIGLGVYLNSIEGTLRQARRALAPSEAGASAVGVNFYSMANTNAAVAANPFSLPTASKDTPVRPFADFASGLTAGKSVDGSVVFDPGGSAIFAEPAAIPLLSWKLAPRTGHLMGFAFSAAGQPLDTVAITIQNRETLVARTVTTDGGGFYGAIDLPPGEYTVGVNGYSCNARIDAGHVSTAEVYLRHPRKRLAGSPRRSSSVPCPSHAL